MGGKISEAEKQRLKDIDIRSVARALGMEVKDHGNSSCFNSEAHNNSDRKPSLGFDNNNRFKCFACGIGGDTLELVMQYKGIGFTEAVQWLQEQYGGISATTAKNRRTERPQDQRSQQGQGVGIGQNQAKEEQADPFAHSEIYQSLLDDCTLSPELLSYWEKRGISRATLERQGIRYLADPKKTFNKLKQAYGIERLKAAGLISAKGGLIFSYNKIMIPFYQDHKPVYIQGRSIEKEASPKYINLSGIQKPLYNIDSLPALDYGEHVYLCEGIPDCLTALERKQKAVAVLGSDGISPTWLPVLSAFKVYFVKDCDKSGDKFYENVKKLFTKAGLEKYLFLFEVPGHDKEDYNDWHIRQLRREGKL